jgi:hypothetical protein
MVLPCSRPRKPSPRSLKTGVLMLAMFAGSLQQIRLRTSQSYPDTKWTFAKSTSPLVPGCSFKMQTKAESWSFRSYFLSGLMTEDEAIALANSLN